MLNISQKSPELQPELFFLPRDTGKKKRIYRKTAKGVEYYSHAEPIIAHDKTHETRVIDGGVAKRRRSAKGIQELRLYMDRVELWHYDDESPDTPRCLSKCYIYMQVLDWDKNAWVNVRFHGVMPKVIDDGEKFFYEYKNEGRTFALEGYWTKGNAKSTYFATAPGEMVRVRGTMLVFSPDEVVINYDDFKGVDIVDDRLQDYPRAGMQMRTITFANDGQLNHIEVDPYIEVREEASYVDVVCDGYTLRANIGAASTLGAIRSNGGTEWYSFGGAETYAVIVAEAAPSFCHLHIIGSTTEVCLSIYPDKIVQYLISGTSGMSATITPDSTENEANHYAWIYSACDVTQALPDASTTAWIVDSADREHGSRLYTATERLEIGGQWNDLALTNPQAITDLNMPSSIATSGFASDGALHVEPDANKEVAITNDITRHKQSVVVHDPHIYTGDPASPTDHLVAHYKLEQVYNTNQLRDEVSGTNLGGGADLVTFEQGKHGNCLVSDSTPDRAYIPGSQLGVNAFSIAFDAKIANAINSETDQLLWFSSGGDTLIFYANYYTTSGPRIYYRRNWSATYCEVPNSETLSPDTWYHFHIVVDMDNGYMFIAVDGKVKAITYSSGISNWNPNTQNLIVGRNSGTNPTYIDSLKIYNAAILPYGAYFTGNGSFNADAAHGDITFYWDCESNNSIIPSTPIVGTNTGVDYSGTQIIGGSLSALTDANIDKVEFTVTSRDIIDERQGSVAFWIRPSNVSNYRDIFTLENAAGTETGVRIHLPADSIRLSYNGVNASASSFTIENDRWHHIRATWDTDNNYLALYVDGLLVVDSTSALTPISDAGKITIGNVVNSALFAYIDQFFITNSPNTPQIPTINGTPVHVPLIEVA